MQPANPAPTAEGSFTKTPFAHLLVYALDRRLGGTFEIDAPNGVRATLVVLGGVPLKVQTTLEATSDEDLAKTGTFAATLERLFALPPEASFKFYDGVDTLGSDPAAASAEGVFDPLPLLWRGIRHSPSWEHVDLALRRVGSHGVRLAPGAEVERFGFGKAELSAVELLRGQPRRVTDLTTSKVVGPSVAQLLVYCLLITKQVDLVELPRTSAAAMPAVRPSTVMAAVAPPAPASSPAIPASSPAIPPSSPAIPPPSPPVASPSSPAVPPSSPAIPPSSPGLPQSGSAVARVQLQRQVARAPIAVEESVVSRSRDGRSATPVPKALSIPPLVNAPAPPKMPEAAAQPTAPQPEMTLKLATEESVPPPPPPLSPEHEALRAKILERAEKISSEDYFEMLGLPRGAAAAECQKAFIALAKVWHPDRLPVPLADVKNACSKVFSHLTEANATLTDPKRRASYLALVKEGGAASPDEQAQVMAVVEAATEFQKAEVFFKRNDFVKAYEHARRAHALDGEQADYLALVTWLEAIRPDEQTKERTLTKIRVLDGCIAKNARCERAYFYRGMLNKRIDDAVSAVRDFKKAAELNPRNLDAAREVRLYTMRTEKAAAEKTGAKETGKTPKEDVKNLLGKLFKK